MIKINKYVDNLKELIERKLKVKIPESWLYPIMLEDFCGCNGLRKDQEELWRDYLNTKKN